MAYSVITISREFGTGARLIGKQLADILGFNYYDRAIIQMAAEKSGLSPEFIERNEEKTNNSFLSTCPPRPISRPESIFNTPCLSTTKLLSHNPK